MSTAPISARVPDLGESGLPDAVAGVAWRRPTIADAPAMHAAYNLSGRVDHPEFQVPLQEVLDDFEASHVDVAQDFVVGERDGEIVAIGSAVMPDGQVDVRRVYLAGTVVPEARRQGIGAVLLAWEERRAAERLHAHGDSELPAQIHTYTEADSAVVPFLTGVDFTIARYFTDLHRDLSQPIVPMDDGGLTIVPFTPDLFEAGRIARNDAFRDHWGSQPTTPERWGRFTNRDVMRSDLSAVAIEGDRIVGFCLAEHDPDDAEVAGYSSVYIALVGVVRDHRGQGIAPRLLTRTLEAARDAGLEKAVLDVDSESPTGAVGLYERLGFTTAKQTVVLERAW
ncbi:GNAT family N-acetyltransferase [Agrococcus jejuensis]|uniref:Ribosomal protein S18 acetylase RimI n=1 Tax=Agrococcus jejuensis TaxID=399736 RepID=A0A1G8BWD1_9MICO|nr:GNAT family N-acetyltransferase [Agrococcus jejuensis]SDH37536.1 Ribosomal protein S18 acetylase RimI [Agrococcus jejuensis]